MFFSSTPDSVPKKKTKERKTSINFSSHFWTLLCIRFYLQDLYISWMVDFRENLEGSLESLERGLERARQRSLTKNAIRGKPSGAMPPKGRRRGWLILIANTTFRRWRGGYGSHGAIIRPSYCGPRSQWERVYTLLSFLWLRPSLSSNRFSFRATDVVLLDLRVPFLLGEEEEEEEAVSGTCATYSGSTRALSSSRGIYLLTQPHTWQPTCVHALSGHNAREI